MTDLPTSHRSDFDPTAEEFAAAHSEMMGSLTFTTVTECANCGEVRPTAEWSGDRQCRRCVAASVTFATADPTFYEEYGPVMAAHMATIATETDDPDSPYYWL